MSHLEGLTLVLDVSTLEDEIITFKSSGINRPVTWRQIPEKRSPTV
jgi:hypothetical protein